jgi:hypothetical protein
MCESSVLQRIIVTWAGIPGCDPNVHVRGRCQHLAALQITGPAMELSSGTTTGYQLFAVCCAVGGALVILSPQEANGIIPSEGAPQQSRITEYPLITLNRRMRSFLHAHAVLEAAIVSMWDFNGKGAWPAQVHSQCLHDATMHYRPLYHVGIDQVHIAPAILQQGLCAAYYGALHALHAALAHTCIHSH